MDLDDFKNDSDWIEVLGYAGKDATYASNAKPPTPVGEDPPHGEPFGMNDVIEIIAADPGENDEQEWVCALELADGRFAYIEAGCDYTGWDCQAGGSAWVACDLYNLIRWGLTDSARSRLKLPLDGVAPTPRRNLFSRLKEN